MWHCIYINFNNQIKKPQDDKKRILTLNIENYYLTQYFIIILSNKSTGPYGEVMHENL
jgi:hypothetical protein